MFPVTSTLEKRARQVLGVGPDAGARVIKKAYRRLARQYHPDSHSDDKVAVEKFLLITEAYQYLLRHKLPGRNSLLTADLTLENEDPDERYARWWMEHFGEFF
ncbi:J domain-containing protein [Moorella sulfitireducens]|uniref:J domain-containing protein n=1 Tax=Neomoorella sulfitireducens TaxID=2972948 RepID=UPI002413DA3F|nr:J domain-containing protein [Moorella sulfitireducens]